MAGECTDCLPSREFSVDAGKPEFVVSVYGRKMGTPDEDVIDSFLETKLSSGLINQLIVLANGIEGGATYCVVVHDPETRADVLTQLQQISTDLNETSYRIESIDNCSEVSEVVN